MSESFLGKAGIVTGAASGIGRATAEHLAGLGAGVCLVDLAGDPLEAVRVQITKGAERAPQAIIADMSSQEDVARMTEQALAEFDRIDFLVTCAGILRRTAFDRLDPEEWDLVMAVNLRGPFLCCRAVVPAMMRQGRGVIVNVASLAGRSSSLLGGAHYTVSKHGVIGLSRHMARELGPHGIRVNAFCPGATLTPMVQNAVTPEELRDTPSRWPIARWGTPEEQAQVIAFLLSDASSFITGACIDSNGGALMV